MREEENLTRFISKLIHFKMIINLWIRQSANELSSNLFARLRKLFYENLFSIED